MKREHAEQLVEAALTEIHADNAGMLINDLTAFFKELAPKLEKLKTRAKTQKLTSIVDYLTKIQTALPNPKNQVLEHIANPAFGLQDLVR